MYFKLCRLHDNTSKFVQFVQTSAYVKIKLVFINEIYIVEQKRYRYANRPNEIRKIRSPVSNESHNNTD